MNQYHFDLIKGACIMGGVRGGTPEECSLLDSLVSDGYLYREDPESPFPGGPKPNAIYRPTDVGRALVSTHPSTQL